MRDIAQHVHSISRTEGLEDRILLTAELAYPGATVGSNSEVTLSFDSSSSQYRLLDSNLAAVSSAPAASAVFGGIRVTGTSDADILRLDTASLSLTGSTLTVGSTTFTLDGFGRATVTGGVSANAFTFGDVTIPAITVDGGGNSDTIFSTVADNAENKGLGETLADAGTLGEAIAFTSVENIVGGRGIDVFTFADGTSLPSTLDGGLGSNALD